MKKVIIIIVIFLALAVMEGISWIAYTALFSKDTDDTVKLSEQAQGALPSSSITDKTVVKPEANQNNANEEKAVSSTPPVSDSENFPSPSTEMVNGVTERTIHIGVRRFEWDPKVIQAKQGELVRLVVHNADVKHGIAIPELGVNEDISEDGAIITFTAAKKGTFAFLCSVYCGVGHAEMQGKIIVESSYQ